MTAFEIITLILAIMACIALIVGGIYFRDEAMRYRSGMIVAGASAELGLYDPHTNKSVFADKMFDATSLCPQSKRCIIKYANDSGGRIAQINDWYEKDVDMGSSVHYFLNWYTPETLAKDVTFVRRAEIMGADALGLAKAIYKNQ